MKKVFFTIYAGNCRKSCFSIAGSDCFDSGAEKENYAAKIVDYIR